MTIWNLSSPWIRSRASKALISWGNLRLDKCWQDVTNTAWTFLEKMGVAPGATPVKSAGIYPAPATVPAAVAVLAVVVVKGRVTVMPVVVVLMSKYWWETSTVQFSPKCLCILVLKKSSLNRIELNNGDTHCYKIDMHQKTSEPEEIVLHVSEMQIQLYNKGKKGPMVDYLLVSCIMWETWRCVFYDVNEFTPILFLANMWSKLVLTI